VIPALAIARELRDAHGAEVRFVGTARGLETRLVPEAGFPLELIHVGQLKNVSVATKLRTMADLPLGVLRCMGLLRDFRPDAMMAAVLLRVPTVAFEPNAVPGLANRLVGKWVSAAAVNFEETRRYFRGAKVTGIPVRREFFAVAPRVGKAGRLLVFGGSQGARALNEVMPRIARELLEDFSGLEIVHQAGGGHGVSTTESYERAGLLGGGGRVRVVPYLDGMVEEVAEADLILCRSGASTVAELAAAGRASVLVPFPQAADDHQRKNADVFVAAGAAELIVEAELTPERLLTTLRSLLGNDARRTEMAERARGLAHPEAVETIGEMVGKLAGRV
jgi:UDP-N-acetylglucosamine--N-acetylmuramyl-(pentapeptide) pyrophosphoryl-undecaprenol N-acetylglucosamine transferase